MSNAEQAAQGAYFYMLILIRFFFTKLFHLRNGLVLRGFIAPQVCIRQTPAITSAISLLLWLVT